MEMNAEPMADSLGHFEELVLTAIMQLGGESYGAPIFEKTCSIAGKIVNHGSLYVTLDRMTAKGLLSSRKTDPAKEPRGIPKTVYTLEPAGLEALENSLENAQRLSEIVAGTSGGIRKWLKTRFKKGQRNTGRQPA